MITRNNENTLRKILAICVFLYLPLLFTTLVYWPGLGGPFLFDDIVNFSSLMHLDKHNTFNRVYQFILTGNAGSLGRPISLLSFMINDNAWPSNPWSFKYTNMLIHMLNGVLVFIVCLQLSRFIHTEPESKYRYLFAGIASTIWLLHPMQTSTVLYVIQRMTQLSTLFTLAGIICFLHGRHLLSQGIKIKKAYWIMSIGVIFFGLTATFSKENGVLIILFIGAIEYSLLHRIHAPASYKIWKYIFIIIPSLVLLAAFIIKFQDFQHGYGSRSFSMYERVLTETRILCDYLYNIFIPRSGGTGLFYDDYIKSTGLLSPPQTLFSIITIAALIIAGFTLRNKYKIVSFAILWFFSGHVLESTIIPLELYFEHRNYLAMLGPVILISSLVRLPVKNKLFTILPVIIFITITSLITYQNNKIWGNHILLAEIWAIENPNSIRAQQSASSIAIRMGNNKKGREYIANVYKKYPDEAALLLQLVQLDCNTRTLTRAQITNAIKLLPTAKYSHATIPTVINLHMQFSKKTCKELTADALINIINALINNKSFGSNPNLHALYYWKGQIYADKHMLSPAMEALDISHKYMGVIDIPLQQAIWLSSAGLYDDALKYIQLAEDMDNRARNPLLDNARKRDIDNLRKLIQKGKASQKNKVN